MEWSTANEPRRWSVMFVLVAIIVVTTIRLPAPMFVKVAWLVIVGFLMLVSKGPARRLSDYVTRTHI